ncbi:Xyloglucan endotransglucosylase/hydrolase protein 22, partial [Cucurbita argyrosperma subsp. sororia]
MAGAPPLCWVVLVVCLLGFAGAGNLNKELEITWGGGRAKIVNGGRMLTLSLDKGSGSGFRSRNQFYVDGTPIREFKNMESLGIPFPKRQPMRLQSSLWNADDWATRGGRVKTDWSNAPFTAAYRNMNADRTCIWPSSSCSSSKDHSWLSQRLDSAGYRKLKWVRRNYMVYDYCADSKRFPHGLPPECNV